MKDTDDIHATHRETGTRRMRAGDGRTVLLRRRYDAEIEDVWQAITDPQRLARWFLPVTGELRVGGSYQLKGNARGEIVRCEPPRLLLLTWVMGPGTSEADISEVEVRLSPDANGDTVLEIEHSALVDPALWAQFGPGAAGVGWDLTLFALLRYLRGETLADPSAWESSPEARPLVIACCQAWGAAFAASGASSSEVAAATANTTGFYAPEPGAAP